MTTVFHAKRHDFLGKGFKHQFWDCVQFKACTQKSLIIMIIIIIVYFGYRGRAYIKKISKRCTLLLLILNMKKLKIVSKIQQHFIVQ